MMQLMKFDNTEARLYISRPPAPFVGDFMNSKYNEEAWTHFGISITNFSDIIIESKSPI